MPVILSPENYSAGSCIYVYIFYFIFVCYFLGCYCSKPASYCRLVKQRCGLTNSTNLAPTEKQISGKQIVFSTSWIRSFIYTVFV